VTTGENEYDAEITGNLRFAADSRADFPAMLFFISISTEHYGLLLTSQFQNCQCDNS
jgi:hypothetical protein